MMQKPRIYVAGKMTPPIGAEYKWTSVLSPELRRKIQSPQVELYYPDETGIGAIQRELDRLGA